MIFLITAVDVNCDFKEAEEVVNRNDWNGAEDQLDAVDPEADDATLAGVVADDPTAGSRAAALQPQEEPG